MDMKEIAASIGLRFTESGRPALLDYQLAKTACIHHSVLPAAAVALALASPELMVRRADTARLRLLDIVIKRGHMDAAEINMLALACGLSLPMSRGAQPFIDHLNSVVSFYSLSQFFMHGREACNGIKLKPSAFDERNGQVIPAQMKAWRKAFRAMEPERQMICATIVWLYRMEDDKTWLGRQPVKWSALHAITALQDRGWLVDWGKLVVLYPGW